MIVFKLILCFEFLIVQQVIIENISRLDLKGNNSSSNLNKENGNLNCHFIIGLNMVIVL